MPLCRRGDTVDLAYRAKGSLARCDLETLWAMLLESCLLAMPLLALGIAVSRWNIHIPLAASMRCRGENNAVLSLGAGIYEEFVFRLVLMTLISDFGGDIVDCRQVLVQPTNGARLQQFIFTIPLLGC